MEHTTQEHLPLDVPVTRRQEWQLDDRTREVGRRGLAEARAALTQAGRRLAAWEAEHSHRDAA